MFLIFINGQLLIQRKPLRTLAFIVLFTCISTGSCEGIVSDSSFGRENLGPKEFGISTDFVCKIPGNTLRKRYENSLVR